MQIDKNVPLPDNIKKRFRIGPLPLGDLDIGDSIFIAADLDETELERVLHSLRIRLRRFTKKHPKFVFSASKDAKKNGMRIWRVKA